MFKSKVGLLLAAAAAYGAYRYSKMSPESKNSLKTKGKDFVDKQLGGLNLFGKKTSTTPNGTNSF